MSRSLLALLIALGVSPAATHAAYDPYGGRGSDEAQHALSLGGGIASPGMTTALGENPAGLAYNQSPKFQFSLSSQNNAMNPLGFGGHFLIGNGYVGAGIGARTFNQFVGGVSSLALIDFGIGAYVDTLNLAIGFSGGFTLSSSGPVWGTYGGYGWSGDLGLLFYPQERFRIGITAYQLLAGVRAFGGGAAYALSPWADLGVDATWNTNEQTLAMLPALGVHLWNFQMQLAYGFRLAGSNWTWLRQGFSAAVGFQAGYNVLIQFYYNHLSLYYAGLTLRL